MASLKEQLQELQKTTVGKVVIIAVPLVIVAIIFLVVFMVVLSGGPESTTSQVPSTSTASSSSSATKESTPAQAGEQEQKEPEYSENLDVFQPRDPFESAIKETTPTATSSASSTSTTSTSTTTTSSSSTPTTKLLALESTYEQSGVMYAKVKYDINSYEVKAGDQIDSSPYKVLRVDSSSVTLLYGDDQLTLNVGQEVYK